MGMPKIDLRLQMFRGDWDQIWSQMRLLWAMEGLVRINQTHIRQFDIFQKRGLVEKAYPPIYKAGIHYETEKGTEIWPDIPSLLTGCMGKGLYPGHWGDCEDLACARAAEYRELPWHYQRPAPWDKTGKKIEMADPRFPQEKTWAGWKKVKGGIPAKPFAKWRRGPGGNYHYHALVLMPDGRLEDPSLVLGMGTEKAFAAADTSEKMRKGEIPVVIQYAKAPDVMVVDPEKPSGYAGGKAVQLDAKIVAMLKKGMTSEDIAATLGDVELGAYLSNTIPLSEGEFDVDAIIGWSRAEGRFVPKTDKHETNRLFGYAKH